MMQKLEHGKFTYIRFGSYHCSTDVIFIRKLSKQAKGKAIYCYIVS